MPIDIIGYDVTEVRRSDSSDDKGGGGIAVYTRKTDGLVFKDHEPVINDPAHLFVRKERVWKKLESLNGKTAICGLYAGFQAPDDRNGPWNESLFEVLLSEVNELKRQGYRCVLLGDYNSHVGCLPGVGIEGNHPSVNRNGRRFLEFLANSNCKHVNGAGDLVTGKWTRQSGGVSTIIDYAVVSIEHFDSVIRLVIDDAGLDGGGSDHNWIHLDLGDQFVKKLRISNLHLKERKSGWKITDEMDWKGFESTVDKMVDVTDLSLNSFALSERCSAILNAAGELEIGRKTITQKRSMASRSLPAALVTELKYKRKLEKDWKTENSNFSNLDRVEQTDFRLDKVNEAERLFMDQKSKVKDLFFERKKSKKASILLKCRGNTRSSIKCFWSHVNKSTSSSGGIDAVLDDGHLHCTPDAIGLQVENHLVKVFSGSKTPIPAQAEHSDHTYSADPEPSASTSDPNSDHHYSSSASPKFPVSDGSTSLITDPSGWLDKKFHLKEVIKSIKKLKNEKARGVDGLPNEFLKNAGYKFWNLLTLLYNKVKESGQFPPGWNLGKVVLVHKRGLRELLGNYRPLTVINCMSGLYSRILNERLTLSVETHGLLSQIQNGFRQGRMATDNAFVLDSILWKYRAKRNKVYIGFLDLVKAYDMVDRKILWKKMSDLGFGGEFLATIQAIYNDDSVQSEVHGVTTKPVFLGRGLRQGCSLSPLLFALYIADLGQDLALSDEGFRLGKVVVSGLLFADDLVVLARSAEGLLRLLTMVQKHASLLHMEINTSKDKSEVIAPDGEVGDLWHVLDGRGLPILSLSQVLQYKYLGTTTLDSMYKTCVEKQKACIKKAHRYKGSCIYLSHDGPDVVDMTVATWSNIAVPAILYGTEMVPFSEASIMEIEKTQNQVAKYALGVPIGTAGICAQLELGMKPFRQLLYEHQLKFYIRVLNLDDDRWVKQAMIDHLSLSWNSPYISYILKIRTQLGLYEMPMEVSVLVKHLDEYFVNLTNAKLASHSLPWLSPVKRIQRQPYTCESDASATIAKCRYDVANIGNKYPRIGRFVTMKVCPLCPYNVGNTVAHIAFECLSIERVRKEQTGLRNFVISCVLQGVSSDLMFATYINGRDCYGRILDQEEFLERGSDLQKLMDDWLSRW